MSEYLFASLSDLQEREERESDALVKKSLAYLRFYCELLRRYLKTLAIKARGGDREALSAALKEMHDYLFLNEEKAAPVMDTYEFDLIAEQIVYGEWNIIKCEGA